MKQHQLRALVAIADSGSVRAGARLIALSQTALTKAIRELEADLHVPLLHRSSKGAQLTPIGLELVERARFILQEFENARAHVERFRGGSAARVAVAALPAFFNRYLPQVFKTFRARYPDAQLNLQDAYLSQTLPKLRDGSVDVALTAILPETLGQDLEFRALGELDLVVIARRGSYRKPIASLAELVDAHWVLDLSRNGVSEIVRQTFVRAGCPLPDKVTECSSAFSTLALVEDCGCIAPSPKIAMGAKSFPSRVVEVALVNPLPRIPFGLLLRRDAKLSPAVEWMCESFRAVTHAPDWDRVHRA